MLKNLLKNIVRFFNLIHIGFVVLAKLMIVAMVVIIAVNITLRFGFESGLMWSEEVALLLVVWFSFLAMAIGVKHGLHININLFNREKAPKWFNVALEKLGDIVVFLVALAMLYYGVILVKFTMTSVMPATNWPSGIMYAVVPAAAILMLWDTISALFGIETYDDAIDQYLAGEGSFEAAMGGK
jgi:TRAP-type C4-dicarboxylate transport system permease small subunit